MFEEDLNMKYTSNIKQKNFHLNYHPLILILILNLGFEFVFFFFFFKKKKKKKKKLPF